MDVWFSWLSALLHLNDSERYSCILPSNGGRLVLTGKRAVAQKRDHNFVVESVESQGFFLIATSTVSAYPYLTLGSHIYRKSPRQREKRPPRAFVMEEVKILLMSVPVRHRYF